MFRLVLYWLSSLSLRRLMREKSYVRLFLRYLGKEDVKVSFCFEIKEISADTSGQVFTALSPHGCFCSDADFAFYCFGMFSQLSSLVLIDLVKSQVMRS